MLAVGMVFQLKGEYDVGPWRVAISDPSKHGGLVLTVPLVGYRDPMGDDTCLIDAKEYPHKFGIACIEYVKARPLDAQIIQKAIGNDQAIIRPPMPEGLLQRIIAGARKAICEDYRKMLD